MSTGLKILAIIVLLIITALLSYYIYTKIKKKPNALKKDSLADSNGNSLLLFMPLTSINAGALPDLPVWTSIKPNYQILGIKFSSKDSSLLYALAYDSSASVLEIHSISLTNSSPKWGVRVTLDASKIPPVNIKDFTISLDDEFIITTSAAMFWGTTVENTIEINLPSNYEVISGGFRSKDKEVTILIQNTTGTELISITDTTKGTITSDASKNTVISVPLLASYNKGTSDNYILGTSKLRYTYQGSSETKGEVFYGSVKPSDASSDATPVYSIYYHPPAEKSATPTDGVLYCNDSYLSNGWYVALVNNTSSSFYDMYIDDGEALSNNNKLVSNDIIFNGAAMSKLYIILLSTTPIA
jgi:hypothetical protein